MANRASLRAILPAEPGWLKQVHGKQVVDVAKVCGGAMPEADASFSRAVAEVCVVMTADCLPVLFCDRDGSVVAAAHAGWRGLADGVLEATIAAMAVSPDKLLAWLGPAIGPQHFEVGGEVRQTFIDRDGSAAAAFSAVSGNKWLADLPLLARQRLESCGLTSIFFSDACTYRDPARYFSYRRDGVTGRMASLIWLEAK